MAWLQERVGDDAEERGSGDESKREWLEEESGCEGGEDDRSGQLLGSCSRWLWRISSYLQCISREGVWAQREKETERKRHRQREEASFEELWSYFNLSVAATLWMAAMIWFVAMSGRRITSSRWVQREDPLVDLLNAVSLSPKRGGWRP
jgi:hypothetical protein